MPAPGGTRNCRGICYDDQTFCDMPQLGRESTQHDIWRGVAGYSVDMLGQMKESLAGSLQQDTAAISPQRCISLYLERLGCAPDAASPRLKVRLPADPHRGTFLCAGGTCFGSSPACM